MDQESMSLNGLKFRFAEEKDSEAFAKWAVENPQIPQRDMLASLKSNNPTCVTLVVEKDGVPVLFAPIYCQINVAFLGFNPELEGKIRLQAMEAMQKCIAAFATLHGVREITVQTAKDYPVAKWAVKHGFKPEARQTFKFHIDEKETVTA